MSDFPWGDWVIDFDRQHFSRVTEPTELDVDVAPDLAPYLPIDNLETGSYLLAIDRIESDSGPVDDFARVVMTNRWAGPLRYAGALLKLKPTPADNPTYLEDSRGFDHSQLSFGKNGRWAIKKWTIRKIEGTELTEDIVEWVTREGLVTTTRYRWPIYVDRNGSRDRLV